MKRTWIALGLVVLIALAAAGIATAHQVTRVKGTHKDDQLTGTPSADLIRALAGNDTSSALEGNGIDEVWQRVDVLRSGSAGDAFVATTEAAMVIQLAVKDRLDREVTFERCWNNHPLAVPLKVGASAQSTGPLALATNGLEAQFFRNVVAELDLSLSPALVGDRARLLDAPLGGVVRTELRQLLEQ